MPTRKANFWTLFLGLLSFHPAVVAEVAQKQPEPGLCIYVVQKGDTLSEILIRLGIQPQYGPSGTVADLASRNSVARNGDLIFPNVRIRIPREMVGKDEVCLSGEQETDASRRIALYSQAEAQIQQTQYANLCRKIVDASAAETESARKGRLLHFAAVCEYEEKNLDSAYKHWQEVLQLNPDPSLLYRANYNLALLECQTVEAAKGYERLRKITPELWQSQTEYDRRAFLDLASFCSERGSGVPAKLDILLGVLRDSVSQELRNYAAEKLQAEFSDPAYCEQSKVALDQIPNIESHREQLRSTWYQTCAAETPFDTHVRLSAGPTLISYRTDTASSQWVGLNGIVNIELYLGTAWALSGTMDSYFSTLSRSGTTLDVRSMQVQLTGGRVFSLLPDLLVQTDLVLGRSSLLTADRTSGYYDMLSYGIRAQARFTEKGADWLRSTVGVSVANSDTSILASNWILTVSADHFPQSIRPFYWGVQAQYSAIRWSGTDQKKILQGSVQVGARW